MVNQRQLRKQQTMINQTLHRKLKIEQQDSTKTKGGRSDGHIYILRGKIRRTHIYTKGGDQTDTYIYTKGEIRRTHVYTKGEDQTHIYTIRYY
jgi:hypothetical protein